MKRKLTGVAFVPIAASTRTRASRKPVFLRFAGIKGLGLRNETVFVYRICGIHWPNRKMSCLSGRVRHLTRQGFLGNGTPGCRGG